MSIKPHLVGHNTKINGVEKFEGIVTRSNYNQSYTDLNPSFDFELFLKNIINTNILDTLIPQVSKNSNTFFIIVFFKK